LHRIILSHAHFHAGNKLEELAVGQVLEILADEEGIKEDMPAWCRATGNELLAIEEKA
jgi:tRNA 2-thiouridine synthesizing protein A